jgi:hypothetical protein
MSFLVVDRRTVAPPALDDHPLHQRVSHEIEVRPPERRAQVRVRDALPKSIDDRQIRWPETGFEAVARSPSGSTGWRTAVSQAVAGSRSRGLVSAIGCEYTSGKVDATVNAATSPA